MHFLSLGGGWVAGQHLVKLTLSPMGLGGRGGLGEISDVWQGTSGTSRDVPAVGLESLSGLKMCCEKILRRKEREKKRERESV